MALYTPCKPSKSWQSLPPSPTAPPRHRSLKHAQTQTQNQKHVQNLLYIHWKDAHIHIQQVYACMLRLHTLEEVFVHTYLGNTNSSTTHTHIYVGMHAPAHHPALPSCHWKIVLHSTEGVMGCYQQDHSMDGCPN